ncbi:hypothetical protein BC332_33389 [Capsicum chinense]|nr:hypothetical protein BC332_33389 [Capsicum chinense]
MLHHVAGTPERAWVLFSLIFILETVIVAIFRPKAIKLLNATHQQAGDLSMTSKPRKGSVSWTSICWFTCSTSCVFYPVWSDSKGIKLAWGYNISCRDNPW